jgi:hypothetical protein
MATVKELIKNKEVKAIVNKNAPVGCYIKVHRDNTFAPDVVTSFTTVFPNGNEFTELANKAFATTFKNDSEDWFAFDEGKWLRELAAKKVIAEKTAKESLVSSIDYGKEGEKQNEPIKQEERKQEGKVLNQKDIPPSAGSLLSMTEEERLKKLEEMMKPKETTNNS